MSARLFTDEAAIVAIQNNNNHSIKAVLRELNVCAASGSNYNVIYRIVSQYGLDTKHWLGKKLNVLFKGVSKKTKEEIFISDSGTKSHSIRLRLFKEGIKEKKCEVCLRKEWMGKSIPLEVDHLNGDRRDNRLENLRIICPNCHAQTLNYKTKNRKLWPRGRERN